MSRVFNGLGAAQAILEMHNDSQDRKDSQRRRENIAAAGQVAADGDTAKASRMLMEVGDLDGAGFFEDLGNTREDRQFERQVVKEDRQFELEERDLARKERTASRQILSDVLGGEQTYKQGAAAMAIHNPEMALGMAEQGRQLTKEQEAQFAQELVNGFYAQPKRGRAKAMREMAEQHKAELDPDIYEMMTNDDPSDDTRAAIMWGTRNGADVSMLQRELEVEFEAEQRRKLLAYEASLEAQARRADNGTDINPYHPSARNMDGADRRIIMKEESEEIEAARNRRQAAERYAERANKMLEIAGSEGVEDGFGPGVFNQFGRSASGAFGQDAWNSINGIMEEMVRETRVPGSGVFTDKDAERAQKSVLGLNKDFQTNVNAAEFASLYAQHARSREDFLTFARETFGVAGGINDGQAQLLWEEYKNSNPLTVNTSEDGDDGSFGINRNYTGFNQWVARQQQIALTRRKAEDIAAGSDEDIRSGL